MKNKYEKETINKKERSNIVLKRNRFGKKTAVTFRRNNLTFEDFIRTCDGYTYEESFNHHGISGKISIFVNSNNLFDIFTVDTKTVKAKGGKDHFGIYLRLADQEELPLYREGIKGCIQYKLECKGGKLYYEQKKRSGGYISGIHRTSKARLVGSASSLSWAVAHPYQGGGFSPR